MCAAITPSSATGSTCANGSRRASACCTPRTIPIVNTTPPGESADRRSTIGCNPSGRATARSRVGSGPIGTHRSRAGYEYSYGRQNWFEHSAAEHRAVRERVGLFDLSSFAKFRFQGAGRRPGAEHRLRQRRGRAPGPHRLHPVAERPGRHRGGSHRHPAGRRRLSDRDRRGHGSAGLPLAATARSDRRPLCADQRDLGHGRDFDHGAERPGAAAIAELPTISRTRPSASPTAGKSSSATG